MEEKMLNVDGSVVDLQMVLIFVISIIRYWSVAWKPQKLVN